MLTRKDLDAGEISWPLKPVRQDAQSGLSTDILYDLKPLVHIRAKLLWNSKAFIYAETIDGGSTEASSEFEHDQSESDKLVR